MSYERALSRVSKTRNLAPVPVDGYIALDEYEGPGSTIRWGSWERGRRPLAPEQSIPITLFPYASGSDYSGNTVEASNYRVLQEDAHVMARSVLIQGDHGTFGIAYIGQPTRRIRAILDALDGYPLLDEDDHSKLEQEIENEQWASWGRDDFRRDLAKAIFLPGDEDELQLTDRELDALWYEFASDHGDMGRVFESPDSCHFYIKEGVAHALKHNVFDADGRLLPTLRYRTGSMLHLMIETAFPFLHGRSYTEVCNAA